MIAATGIEVRFGRRVVLHDVSVAVRPGELLALTGPNGAGKSTLLAVLGGDRVPDAGSVQFDDAVLATLSRPALARRRAILPQTSMLQAPFRVEDVVLMGRAPFTTRMPATMRSQSRDRTIAADALRQVGLETFGDRRYTELSGGERQRVQLARVLAQVWDDAGEGTRALLLDEPVASLDLAQQHRALGAARDAARRGLAVVVVIHDLNLAAQYADRIALLVAGEMCVCGSPSDVLTAERVSGAYRTPVMVMNHPCAECPLVVSVPEVWQA